jgi:hypothetical protein
MAIRIDLSDDEATFLREIVEWRLKALPLEIAHTDHAPYRELLRNESEALERVLDRIVHAAAPAPVHGL